MDGTLRKPVPKRVTSLAMALLVAIVMLINSASSNAEDSDTGPDPIRMMAVGDIMLDAVARPVMDENGYDYAFLATKPLFDSAHVVFGNLEGPLTDRGTEEKEKTFVFRSPAEPVARALKQAGFNVVSLANNHTMDYGAEGLKRTVDALDQAGVGHAGAGNNVNEARQPAFIRVGSQQVAILAYSLTFPENFWATPSRPGTAFGHEAQVREDVVNARRTADVVVVSFHWGRESQTELRDYQIQLGHAAIEAGAAAVVGHHPHILQAVEQYKDGVIIYSLGNFAFGSRSRKSLVSAIAELQFERGILRRVRMLPLTVDNLVVNFQPTPLSGDSAKKVIDHLIELSEARHTKLAHVGDAAVLEISP